MCIKQKKITEYKFSNASNFQEYTLSIPSDDMMIIYE